MILKRPFLAAMLSLAAFVSNAQTPTEKSLLWKISGNGLAAPSYLFGTIHLLCPADFQLSNALKNAVASSKQVALEIDMDDPGMMAAVTKTMFMKDGKTLKTVISDTEYQKIRTFYKDSVGMDISQLEKAKPFILSSLLFNKLLNCQPESFEMTLTNLAQKQKSEVIGLETVEEQMAVFDSIPYEKQADMIVKLIDDLPNARKEFSEMVELYKQQDLPALYELTIKSDYGMDGRDEVMLFRRNASWIVPIQAAAKSMPTLFAVGAAHLGGERGVIALLRKAGYEVTPLTTN